MLSCLDKKVALYRDAAHIMIPCLPGWFHQDVNQGHRQRMRQEYDAFTEKGKLSNAKGRLLQRNDHCVVTVKILAFFSVGNLPLCTVMEIGSQQEGEESKNAIPMIATTRQQCHSTARILCPHSRGLFYNLHPPRQVLVSGPVHVCTRRNLCLPALIVE
jgi:hypothetical protein